MAERGIIFSAPMVRALLDGRKTQTRRLLNPQPGEGATHFVTGRGRHIWDWPGLGIGSDDGWELPKVRRAVGDRLYVREAWSHTGQGVWDIAGARMSGRSGVIYHVDGTRPGAKYWPSIHMPREFSRLTLAITDVRVQRLQEINEVDAICEGVTLLDGSLEDPREAFAALWNSLHTKPGTRWGDNPWLYALTFTVTSGNIDRVPT